MTAATIGPFSFDLEMIKGDKGDTGPAGMGASTPGGRATLVGGQPDMPQNVDYSSGSLSYSPDTSDKVLVCDGTGLAAYSFTAGPTDEIGPSLSCGAKWTANAQRDVFAIVVGGVVLPASGPAWPGTSMADRKLCRYAGLWVNSEPLTLDTSATESVLVPAYQATWITSINPASTGTLTATFTPGQNRRCDLWNVYNQRDIILPVGQPPVSGSLVVWVPDTQYTVAFKAFNNDANNKGKYFTGLPQDVEIEWVQRGFVNSLSGFSGVFWAICKNAITNPVGTWGGFSSDTTNDAGGFTGVAKFVDRASVGAQEAIMGTAKANTVKCSLWGMYPPGADLPPLGAQAMHIKYRG